MAGSRLKPILQHLRRTVSRQGEVARTDGQLLAAFLEHRDEAAFEDLVRRHGPMVLGVCRRILGNHHDAEDAFQATFLVLARKAASIWPRERVGNWLYGVAHTTALRARSANARRRLREMQMKDRPAAESVEQDPWTNLLPLLDQELARLPDKYREVLVLADLEGRTRKEVARQLRIPEGTVASRLVTARQLLARKMARHGLPVSTGALAAVLAQNIGSASVPSSLISHTVQSACLLATGQAVTAAAVSTQVALLMEGVLKMMLLTRLKVATTIVLTILACSGIGVLAHEALGQAKAAPGPQGSPSLEASRKGGESLQGVWRILSSTQPDDVISSTNGLFLVRGNRFCWQSREEEPLEGGLYLDPSSSPKAFDFATSQRTLEGIYALEGDTLWLCWDLAPDAKRPRQFAAEPGSHQILMVLKREKGHDLRGALRADGSRGFPNLLQPAGPVSPLTGIAPVPPPPVPTSPVPPATVPAPPVYAPPPPPTSLAPMGASTVPPQVTYDKPPCRVGQILIVGNEKTPTEVILKHVLLYPGRILDFPSLRKTEANLAELGLFVVDPKQSIRPTVEVLDKEGPNPCKDILITVQEKQPDRETSRTLQQEANELRQALKQLEEHLTKIKDPETHMRLQKQIQELHEGLKRLHQWLPEGENNGGAPSGTQAGPQSASPYPLTGLTGNIVLNERNFDIPSIAQMQAEKDLRVAEFYLKLGQQASALFYYELISRRYPGTTEAATAKQRMDGLKKNDPAKK